MGDADLVRASGGTVTVDGSDTLQGLSFFVAENDGQVISSYTIEDNAAELISTSTSVALASLNVAGVSSITLVDASVSDLANAADGASLNAIAHGLTDGRSITFNVRDFGDGLNDVLGADKDLSQANKVELQSDDGSLVLDITSTSQIFRQQRLRWRTLHR